MIAADEMRNTDMRALQMVPAASITDDEVAVWLATRPVDARVRTLEYIGRDNSNRPMLRLKADGLEAGTYSIGRVIAMLSGSDSRPRYAPAYLPADPRAGFHRKTDARQMTDGELEWIEDMLGPHPHVSVDDACREVQRRQDERRAMKPSDRRRVERHAEGVALNEERVAAIRLHGLPDDGLPPLKGTEKQVAYAVEIRAAYAKSHPGDRALKAAKTAAYWINNHKAILKTRMTTNWPVCRIR